ncbi:hypothetical protein [Burkholderia gladioli]|uniref:hypothetical protein n=1 Tax=Burkholderia gladioli TaxID=28095 RepID=UPI002FDFCB51
MTSRQNIKPSAAQRLVMQPLTDAAMREALDEFELVCENNDVRKLTDDEKYAAQEFALSLIHGDPSAEAEATEKLVPMLTLTGAQLLEALDLIAPDRTADQLESEVSFQHGNGHDGEGMYCWMTEYPDEGATKIDGSTVAAQAVAADGTLTMFQRAIDVGGKVIPSYGERGDMIALYADQLAIVADGQRGAVSPATADTPLNGIAETIFHGEGAISRCSYCGRYSLDRKTLGDRPPKCECGEKYGWSGSFEKPGPDAKWSGAAPVGMTATADERAARDELLQLDVLLADFHAAVWRAGAGEDGPIGFDLAGKDEAKAIQRHVRAMLVEAAWEGFQARASQVAAPQAATAEESEDAYVIRRLSETLADVCVTLRGDDPVHADDPMNKIELVKRLAEVIRLEVELYRAQADAPADARPTSFHFHRFVNGQEMAEDVLIERATTIEAAIKEAVRICPKRPMTVLVHAPAWVGALHGSVLAKPVAPAGAREPIYQSRLLKAPAWTDVSRTEFEACAAKPDQFEVRTLPPVTADAGEAVVLRAEVNRLNAIINTPQAGDFLRAVSIEAEHQRQRWSSKHDSGKMPADWFWLVGYLAGKALHAHAVCDEKKAEHHIITTAAALANWHLAIFGKSDMRPGTEQPGVQGAQRGKGGEA